MKILAIETSCDETAAAVTQGTAILASVKVTQEIHSQWGGVVPSLAKRDHEANIEWVIRRALEAAGVKLGTGDGIGAIAVTVGPGLAIALGVGITEAKELAIKYNKPLIAVNHVEGHILSCLAVESADSNTGCEQIRFPCAGLVISGGHTQLILVREIGRYQVLAESIDDDIGEALDKGARLLGLPYPGGPALEKLASGGNSNAYQLPLPMAGREDNRFSYAGLKTAFGKLVTRLDTLGGGRGLTQQQKADLAACYQDMAFKHLLRVAEKALVRARIEVDQAISDLLVGGGVAANSELRRRLSDWATRLRMTVHYPQQLVLCTDNAAMIGVAAGFKAARGEFISPEEIDRRAKWRVDEPQ